ncbi:MAG: ribonuclease HII [Puniceicoccaceae bacterium]|nr:MAG: ribonuclease HII [Puniceicoccaceae bacterium]
MNPLQTYDQNALSTAQILIGVDEAGRGCLAGPVVAGACLVTQVFFASPVALAQSAKINDSKQLSAEARASQLGAMEVMESEGLIDFAVAMSSVEEITQLNILGATRLAMQRALEQLAERASGWALPCLAAEGPLFSQAHGAESATSAIVKVLVDGRPLKPFPYTHHGLVRGDSRSLSIAMASIAAKVARDREMHRLAQTYPQYGFEQHKGYGTAAHRAAIREHGPSPLHRELFLRKLLGT